MLSINIGISHSNITSIIITLNANAAIMLEFFDNFLLSSHSTTGSRKYAAIIPNHKGAAAFSTCFVYLMSKKRSPATRAANIPIRIHLPAFIRRLQILLEY
jgi:hypothetical protein